MIIDGLACLEDVSEELGIDFGKVEFETLNGYLTNLLGHIPTEDDLDKEIVVNGYRFQNPFPWKQDHRKGTGRKDKKEPKGEDKKCQDIQNSQT
ncbi:MAG: transporter associated domain-containing protein [Ruminococcus sp.]